MQLKIFDIPAEGLDLVAKSDADPWYRRIIQEAFREDYPGSLATLELHFLKTCDNVTMTGVADVDLTPTCDGCLESFAHHVSIPVEVVLAPVRETPGTDPDEIKLESEDLNFAFYTGDSINLADLVREFLVLSIPIRYLCKEDCKGICPHCGANLNRKACSCRPPSGDPRFAVLKKIRHRL